MRCVELSNHSFRWLPAQTARSCRACGPSTGLSERRAVGAKYRGRKVGKAAVFVFDPARGRIDFKIELVRLCHPAAVGDRSRSRHYAGRARTDPIAIYFSPFPLQPFYRERLGFREGGFPVAERVATSTLALPFHTNMPDGRIEYVVESLAAATRRRIL
jgi:perosamine synthetase